MDIGAPPFILRILDVGCYLPFVTPPSPYFAVNHSSTRKHTAFVDEAIENLVVSGSVIATVQSSATVCSPLGVMEGKKLRLILDLRELNKHLLKCTFKYEDIRTVANMFDTGNFFFMFDLKSAYHHVDTDLDYYRFLGFSWKGTFYTFVSLPFGLSTAPYIFSKICKVLMNWWRRQGHRVLMYLDDGTGCANRADECLKLSDAVRHDLMAAGFLLSDKSRFPPQQKGEFLGYVVDLGDSTMYVTESRIAKLFALLGQIKSGSRLPAGRLAQIAGSIISMGPALGPITRLRTRELHNIINTTSLIA